jgi:hypothetical protein
MRSGEYAPRQSADGDWVKEMQGNDFRIRLGNAAF